MIVIIGASGHSGEIFQLIQEDGILEEVYFYDDIMKHDNNLIFEKYKIINSFQKLEQLYKSNRITKFTLGLGNPTYRKTLYYKFLNIGLKPHSTISADTYINQYKVKINNGVNIMPGVKISNNVTIDKGCLIYYNAIITHDVSIGEFCEISPSANILGGCKIGNCVHIGANATILPKLKIGDNSIIGAGSVVTKDVPSNVVIAGVPAKVINTIKQ